MSAVPALIDGEVRIPMTYRRWLFWSSETRLSEWVDGEAIEFPLPDVHHQELMGFLLCLLGGYVRERNLGTVLKAPFEVKLSLRSSREPDILFVATANLTRFTEPRLEGPPDLAIEIVSDDSFRRDHLVKREEYAAGVREYWLIDSRPGRNRHAFLLLDASGRFREAPRDEQGRFHSTVVPGFWLDPVWLGQDPLPFELDCWLAIDPGLLERLRQMAVRR